MGYLDLKLEFVDFLGKWPARVKASQNLQEQLVGFAIFKNEKYRFDDNSEI